ncbi:UNKNOWN [Stylonychia lemnae]|uniref:Zinc finger PHD-type domain-containing protein n=1 Tax=Stylonychia lemnae TaxID=5949 RepID=A0A078AVW6_STYLE|nr:UNKNOWN [Stylonychia lemnae]|eukprot:CDW86590.1 UNKNOWN [Stylonychia lemnae]
MQSQKLAAKDKQQISQRTSSTRRQPLRSSQPTEEQSKSETVKLSSKIKKQPQQVQKQEEMSTNQQQNSKQRQKSQDKLSQRRGQIKGDLKKTNQKPDLSDDEEMKDESAHNNDQSEEIKNKRQQQKSGKFKGLVASENKVKSDKIVLQDRIKNESQMESKQRIKFNGFKENDSSNQMCQICFQVMKYPLIIDNQSEADDHIDEDESFDEDELTDEQKEAKRKYNFPNNFQLIVLYQLVYCQDCTVPVHLNCLGEGFDLYEIIRHNYKYIIFKCERCSLKQKDRTLITKCVACNFDSGFIKAVKIDKPDDQGADEYMFIHQICAFSFKDNFYLSDPIKMELKLRHSKEHFLEDWIQKKQTCTICKGNGKLVECSIKDCDKFAHAYCIMNLLKEYYYYQSISDEEGESKNNNRWMYQLFFSEDQIEIVFQILCTEHYVQHAYYCYCDNQSPDSGMVICEYCNIWYHESCTQPFEKENKYRCKKCEQWIDKIQNPLLDIVLKRKTYNELTNEDHSKWNFDGIYFTDQETLNTESKIFEQILYTKAWHQLSRYLIEEVTSESLIEEHLKIGRRLFLSSFEIEAELKQRLKTSRVQVSLLIADLKKKSETEFKEELDDKLQLNQENIKFNKGLLDRLQKNYLKILNDEKFINDEVIELKNASERYKVLQEANQICKVQKQKPEPEEVQDIIDSLQEQQLHQFKAFSHLSSILSEYQEWEQQCIEKLKSNVIIDEKIENKFENFKKSKRGIDLQERRFHYLKEVFVKKQTCEEGLKMVLDGQRLRVDITEDLKQINSTIVKIEKAEKEINKMERSNNKPVKNILTAFKVLACMPLKTKNIENLLQKWHQSSLWNSRASYFIKDKKYENLQLWVDEVQQSQQEGSSMDIDEGNSIKQNNKNYQWTLASAQLLLDEADQKKIYFDLQLYNQVKEKIMIVERLKMSLRVIKQDKHDEKTLQNYLKELRYIENVDFSKEINETKQKLRLMSEVNQAVTNDSKNKQNIEMLEELMK